MSSDDERPTWSAWAWDAAQRRWRCVLAGADYGDAASAAQAHADGVRGAFLVLRQGEDPNDKVAPC